MPQSSTDRQDAVPAKTSLSNLFALGQSLLVVELLLQQFRQCAGEPNELARSTRPLMVSCQKIQIHFQLLRRDHAQQLCAHLQMTLLALDRDKV